MMAKYFKTRHHMSVPKGGVEWAADQIFLAKKVILGKVFFLGGDGILPLENSFDFFLPLQFDNNFHTIIFHV